MPENTIPTIETGDPEHSPLFCSCVPVNADIDMHIASLSAVLNKHGAPVGYFVKQNNDNVLFYIAPEVSDSYVRQTAAVLSRLDKTDGQAQAVGVTMPAPFGLDPA